MTVLSDERRKRILTIVILLEILAVMVVGADKLFGSASDVETSVASAASPESAGNVEHDGSRTSLAAALENGDPITLVGLGSSVALGTTLRDPSEQTPAGRFAHKLRSRYPDADIEATNLAVADAVALDGLALYEEKVRPLRPTALVIAFGMSDGLTADYNAGQTLPGGLAAVRSLVTEAQEDGTTVILLTTPSPHTERLDFSWPDGVPVTYPNPNGKPLPLPEDSVTQYRGAPFSVRHAEFNDGIRKIAEETGALLGDAAEFWARTVAARGEDAMFDPGESIHPNLMGHRSSYWPALDEVIRQLEARVSA